MFSNSQGKLRRFGIKGDHFDDREMFNTGGGKNRHVGYGEKVAHLSILITEEVMALTFVMNAVLVVVMAENYLITA
jgi:hypothetical protein